jgi:hypothetical protein
MTGVGCKPSNIYRFSESSRQSRKRLIMKIDNFFTEPKRRKVTKLRSHGDPRFKELAAKIVPAKLFKRTAPSK